MTEFHIFLPTLKNIINQSKIGILSAQHKLGLETRIHIMDYSLRHILRQCPGGLTINMTLMHTNQLGRFRIRITHMHYNYPEFGEIRSKVIHIYGIGIFKNLDAASSIQGSTLPQKPRNTSGCRFVKLYS